MAHDYNELESRVCIVTGAAGGLGAAIAQAFVKAGACVLITDRNAAVLHATAAALGVGENRVRAMQHDVTDEPGWQDVIDVAVSAFGGLDVLVNNAGMHLSKPVLEIGLAELREMLGVNLESVFLGTKAAIPALRDSPTRDRFSGSIVNMSSVAGLVGSVGGSVYGMTKGGVRLFTKSVALELAPLNIRVNSVHPGLADTDMATRIIRQRAAAVNSTEEDARSRLAARYPLGRLAQPNDIANAVVFLAGEGSAFMTGSELVVDGGFTAR
jgi:NAD(P)-dependent dehydrogenase (short-subunit alcohol dehydrogenase family)